ncbi:MAG: GntR family transcriptional regulator, partial [Blastocatellia bacterium]
MIFDLKRDGHLPLYEQIAVQLKSMIAGGALKVGDRLPANRDLAKTLGV